MATTSSGESKQGKRGLASASKQTRSMVARMGGQAYHKKRGRNGSDNHRSAE